MFHKIMIRCAEFGAPCSFGLLALASVISLAIISDRVWFIARRRLNFEAFARDVLQLARAREWAKARNLAGRSSASACIVIATGLNYVGAGRGAMRAAMRATSGFERTRLEGQMGLLGTLGQSAILVGLLGTVFELVRLSSDARSTANSLLALTPIAAGLVVAIPALLVSKFWVRFVGQTLRQIDGLSDLLLLQTPRRRRRKANAQQTQTRAA